MKAILKKDELKTIDQVLVVPLHAIDVNELVGITGLDKHYITKLHNQINEALKNGEDNDFIELNMDTNDFVNLVKVYSAAVPLVEEFDDIHTLTGYTKEEVKKLMRTLQDMVEPVNVINE